MADIRTGRPRQRHTKRDACHVLYKSVIPYKSRMYCTSRACVITVRRYIKKSIEVLYLYVQIQIPRLPGLTFGCSGASSSSRSSLRTALLRARTSGISRGRRHGWVTRDPIKLQVEAPPVLYCMGRQGGRRQRGPGTPDGLAIKGCTIAGRQGKAAYQS